MFLAGLSEDYGVLQANYHVVLNKVLERLVKEGGEGGRGINYAETHELTLKGPVARTESRLRFPPCGNADLAVSSINFDLAKDSAPCLRVKKVVNDCQ